MADVIGSVDQVRQALEDGLPGVLPQRDREGRRLLVLFASQWDSTRYSIFDIHRALYLTLECLLNDEVNGITYSSFHLTGSFAQQRPLLPERLHEPTILIFWLIGVVP